MSLLLLEVSEVPLNQYRPDIDGLRAISVLSVMFYHLGSGFVPGGFVGVDVFFVISGYLISRQIFSEVSEKKFSILRFYERRARRILPAYCFVSILSLVGAWYLFLPAEFMEFAKSLIASTLFASNIYFWLSANYFSPASDTFPLLHYWSLGVEEQFYLFFPLLVIMFARFRSVRLLILATFIVSLALSYVAVHHRPVAAFYLTPFRAWELLAGSIIALRGCPRPGEHIAIVANVFGVFLILLAAATFNDQMSFPGLAAIPPCLGAVMILWAGQAKNSVSDTLGSQPLRFIGKISYSLYLVHWPLIVFAKASEISVGTWSIATASIIIATLSYFFIEQPVRTNKSTWIPRRLIAVFGMAMGTLVSCGIVIVFLRGVPERMPSSVQALLDYQFDYTGPYRSGKCFLDPEQTFEEFDAASCLSKDRPEIILWGDSYAAHYASGLTATLGRAGLEIGQMTASACPPIVDLDIPIRPNCKAFNNFALATILKMKPDMVIVSAHWPIDKNSLSLLSLTIKTLDDAGIETLILGQGPIYNEFVPSTLALREMSGNTSTMSDGDLSPEIYVSDRLMRNMFGKTAKYLSVLNIVCVKKRCPMAVDGSPVHWDRGHLTTIGSMLFGEELAPFILAKLHRMVPINNNGRTRLDMSQQ